MDEATTTRTATLYLILVAGSVNGRSRTNAPVMVRNMIGSERGGVRSATETENKDRSSTRNGQRPVQGKQLFCRFCGRHLQARVGLQFLRPRNEKNGEKTWKAYDFQAITTPLVKEIKHGRNQSRRHGNS